MEEILLLACKGGDFNLALQLIQLGCDPKSVRGWWTGYTPLHYACEKGADLEFVKTLVENYSCDPNCRSKWISDRVTPFHVSCREGRLDLVKYLITEQNCNPQCVDKDRQTPLHEACRSGRLDLVKYLITEQNCNPQCTDALRQTPLHLACSEGSLDVVKYFITEQNCNPQCTDWKGQTPLHVACRKGNKDIVRYLLRKAQCDANLGVQRTLWNAMSAECVPGTLPLQMTSNTSIIRELIECGANPEKIRGKLPKNCPKQPTELAIKVLVVGDKGVGKSTLTKALSLPKGVLAKIMNRWTPVLEVDANTAGIIPHDVQSKIFGHAILYDFAGHKEFYASHIAVLRNATLGSTAAIIIVVVDLRESDGKIVRSIQSWLHLISTACRTHARMGPKPHLIIIGSRADLLMSKGIISRKRNNTISYFPIPDIHFVGFVAVDCRYAASSSMSDLCQILSESCHTLRNDAKTSFNSHCFFLYLLQKYRGSPAVSVHTIVTDFLRPQEQSITWLTELIPEVQEPSQVLKLCEEMNEKGNILLLRNEASFKGSWVVLNQEALLCRVTGTIFAPENSGFKEYREIANTTGVVPFSKLKGIFQDLDPKMLVKFLCHLEFCHEITDSESLQLLHAVGNSATPNEMWLFFPGLVKIDAPGDVWEADDKFVYQSGWLLQCCLANQFFTPHFLQVLLLRLAFSFALALEDSHISYDHPALQRKCLVWKNGISWSNRDGVDCLVEIEDRQVLVMLRCPKGADHELGYIRLRSSVVRKVLDTLGQLCSNISTNEIILHSLDIRYPLNKGIQHFNIREIAAAITEAKPSAVSSTSVRPEALEDLLLFEPYAQLGQHILEMLFCESESDRKISDKFLHHIAHRIRRNNDMFIHCFDFVITDCFERRHQVPPPYSDLVGLMQVWRDHSEGSYHCLRRELDQFSVFAGRNPLVLAGCPTKGASGIDVHQMDMVENMTRPQPSNPQQSVHSMAAHQGSKERLEASNTQQGDPPTMMELVRFRGSKRRINIPQEISTKCHQFGILLLEDSTGARVRNISQIHRDNPEQMNMDILEQWLDGNGKQPVTWETLVTVLYDVELTTLAFDIQEIKLHCD